MTHSRSGALLGPELEGQLIEVGGSGQVPGFMFDLVMNYAIDSQALYTVGLKGQMFA